MTGIKLVYWYCQLNADMKKKLKEHQQVLYCGPSNSAVDVVTGKIYIFPSLHIIVLLELVKR